MATDLEKLKESAQLAKEGRFDEALTVLERLLIDSPEDPDIPFMVGACHFKKGDSSQAKSNWRRVLQIDPEHAKVAGMLAQLVVSEGLEELQPLTKAQKAVAEKASQKKPSQTSKPWLKWALRGVLPLLTIVLVFGILSSLQSYRFPGGGEKKTNEGEGSAAAPTFEDPARQRIPLESGLPGRWLTRWEGDPATLTFYEDGNMAVMRDMRDSGNRPLKGSYKIEGDTLTFNLTYNDPQQGGKVPVDVTMYNAEIEGTKLTFKFKDPDGADTLAVRQ